MSDLLFFGGVILTQEPAQPRAEALAVRDGRIVGVGSRAEIESLAGGGARRIDLGGRTLLPGFNDAHVHVWKLGHLLTTMLDLRSVESLRALEETLRAYDATLGENAWLLGRGYNEAQMTEGRQPTRWDLDRAVPHRPVALRRTCGHMMVVNSRALELAGVTSSTREPPGGRIDRDPGGEPTGLLKESAMGLLKRVIPPPSVEEYEAMIAATHRHQVARGITSATEAGAEPDLLLAYRELERRRALAVRMNVMAMRLGDGDTEPLPLPERFLSDFLRVDSVKLFADGGLSGATAALRAPYRDTNDRGVVRLEEEDLFELAREAGAKGLRVATHAIGDRAIDTVLTVYEKLPQLARPRLEHFGLPDGESLRRAVRRGAIAVPQTVFLHSLGANFRRYLTGDYLRRVYPIRSMLDAGVVVALSSDAPVVPDDNPLLGIQAAVTRQDRQGESIAPEEAIGIEEALYAYTMGGAIASGDQNNRGSLAPGKWADVVVLDQNPFDVAPGRLSTIAVDMTFIGGGLVFERKADGTACLGGGR